MFKRGHQRFFAFVLFLVFLMGCEKKESAQQRAVKLSLHLAQSGSTLEVRGEVAVRAAMELWAPALEGGTLGIRGAAAGVTKFSVNCVDLSSPGFAQFLEQNAGGVSSEQTTTADAAPTQRYLKIVNTPEAVEKYYKLRAVAWSGISQAAINQIAVCPPAPPLTGEVTTLPNSPVDIGQLTKPVCQRADRTTSAVTCPEGSTPAIEGKCPLPAGSSPAPSCYPGSQGDFKTCQGKMNPPVGCKEIGSHWSPVPPLPAGGPNSACPCEVGDCTTLYQDFSCNLCGQICCVSFEIGTHQGPLDPVSGLGAYCAFGCFAKGTKIQMEDRSEKLAEEIKAGDSLWNPIKKSGVRVKRVAQGTDLEGFYELKAGTRTLTVTAIHPLPTKRGMLLAKELTVGDIVFDAENRPLKLESIRPLIDQGAPTYNFDLDAKTNDPNGRILVGNGIATGDLKTQSDLQKKGFSHDLVKKRLAQPKLH